MDFKDLKSKGVPELIVSYFQNRNITKLNSAQEKAVKAGLLEGNNMLVCTPTGSGKTAIATILIGKNLEAQPGSKIVYLVPLKALASEKLREYKEVFKDTKYRVAMSIGDIDSNSAWLENYDVIIMTVEKMDSLIRHHCPWLPYVTTVIVDEIHLLNDVSRGPTLEVLLTILRQILKKVQIVALSATIGNAGELAEWLDASLVADNWRPVKLYKGVYLFGKVEFDE
ncbi:DEAD/DEAH box helicase [Candidatus Woesearchaeota archaeon]|nr:DEAD/DEAH box helicase [Candidatus Woesearchaeota archaeon]